MDTSLTGAMIVVEAYQYGSDFNMTMHSSITGNLARMMALKRLIKHTCSHSDVEFMRCIDVAQSWTEQGIR